MKKRRRVITFLLAGLMPPLIGLNVLLFGRMPGTSAGGNSAPGFLALAVKMAVLLGAILVLIYITFYLLRRFVYRGGFGSGNGQVEVLQIAPLMAKKSLCVVRVVDRILVLGLAENSISMLTEIKSPEQRKHWETVFQRGKGTGRAFSAQLESFLKGNRN